MVNTCVMCNSPDELPEGTHVCFRCKSMDTNEAVRCSNCSSILEVMSRHWYDTSNGHARNTVFHCNTCDSDWEMDEEFVAKTVKFTRKFWG